MKKTILLSKIKYILVFFSLLSVYSKMAGQTIADNPVNCQTGISIQVLSSSATNIVLGNAAPFLFVPQAGQVTNYTLTKIGTSTPFAQQTVLSSDGGSNNTFNFQLPSSVTTADFIFVQMTITNTNGDVCYIEDILRWTPTGTPPFQFFFWNNVNSPGNFGTYSNVLSTSDFENTTISLFPNPVLDNFEISGNVDTQSYTIYSPLGTKVQAGRVSKNEKIDIQNCTTGIYFLKLENGETIKFLKK